MFIREGNIANDSSYRNFNNIYFLNCSDINNILT